MKSQGIVCIYLLITFFLLCLHFTGIVQHVLMKGKKTNCNCSSYNLQTSTPLINFWAHVSFWSWGTFSTCNVFELSIMCILVMLEQVNHVHQLSTNCSLLQSLSNTNDFNSIKRADPRQWMINPFCCTCDLWTNSYHTMLRKLKNKAGSSYCTDKLAIKLIIRTYSKHLSLLSVESTSYLTC